MSLYTGILLVTLALLLVTLVSIYSNRAISLSMKNSCVALCAMIALAALGEWCGVMLDGADPATIPLHTAAKVVEFCAAPVIGVATAQCYSRVRKPLGMGLLVLAHTVFQVAAAFHGWVFYIDGNNIYHRSAWYGVYMVVFSASLLYSFVSIIREEESYQRRPDATLVATLLFLVAGIVIQMSDSALRVDFLSVAIGNQLLYDHRCKIIAQMDGLTDLLNRRCYDKDIERLQPPAVILGMDVDRFKTLNDTCGHAAGDFYLKAVAEAIRQVYGPYGFCYRCGGDEFCVILDKGLDRVEELNDRFQRKLAEMRQQDERVPQVSIGCARYEEGDHIRKVIEDADTMMYGRKQQRETDGKRDNNLNNELVERLLLTYFDSVVLIDTETDTVVPLSQGLVGRLGEFIPADGSYSGTADAVAERLVQPEARGPLRMDLELSCIRERLNQQEAYSVEFHTELGDNGGFAYRRMTFRYRDAQRRMILLVCEDASKVMAEDMDPLTGLYDSEGFHRRVTEWIAGHPGQRYRIHRYDIDRFKDINGIYGYDMGNRLLQDCGRHMKQHDTKDSFAAHLNADHFVRFCSEDSPSPQAYYDGFAEAFANYRLKIPIALHMGVYDLCEPGCDSFTMSYKALLALQQAKGKSDREIVYYEKGMMDTEVERQELLNEVDRAIANEEFEVWFQPQVDYLDGRLLGAEALIRWRHPEKGLLAPGVFIPVLESSEQIADVDRYMVGRTCAYVKKWMEELPDYRQEASVNLSRTVIHQPGFAREIRALVDSCGVPPERLHLEITESAYVQDSEKLLAVVRQLRGYGFAIEMDDFGSGYSSLNTLKDIDIDVLKLDMKFLSDDRNSQRSKDIISSVIHMAQVLHLPVLAEGVETKEQADMLLDFGCRRMQGYYFSRPVPAEEYERMLRSGTTRV